MGEFDNPPPLNRWILLPSGKRSMGEFDNPPPLNRWILLPSGKRSMGEFDNKPHAFCTLRC